jgi:aromatic-L-amino-acid decarboxylase
MILKSRPAEIPVNPALFPPADVRRKWDDYLTEMLADAERRVNQGPVTPRWISGRFRQELDAFDFETPADYGKLLAWTVGCLEQGLVHLTHPRYLGLFNPAPTFAAQCADRIAASFNPQLASATTSPAAVQIEAHVARAVARRIGLGERATGHFTSGGSEANGTALICALTLKEPGFALHGARAFAGKPVFYISRDSHLAWIKLAHQAGIGRDAARQIPTDGNGRMSAVALEAAIRADHANGCVPFMVAATAGTTNAGMVDPLSSCVKIASAHALWYHVDAAWGGALIASPQLRGAIAGIEQADSVTIDAHKWFAVTMGCGMFITRHPEVLTATFNVMTSFMPSYTADIDPYLNSAQWSRRFSGLRLFLSLAAGGWSGYAAQVERSVALATLFAERITQLGWHVHNSPALAVVCATPPGNAAPVREIVARVLASGRAWIAAARFEDVDVVRICVTHGRTTIEDIEEVVSALEGARLWADNATPDLEERCC